jgi:hypothetical protein
MNGKRIGTAVLGTGVAMTLSAAMLAGTGSADPEASPRQIAGTWTVTVQPDGAPAAAAFESTLVYTSTGSVIEATSRMPTSAGLGAWERLGSGRYSMTVTKYRFNGTTFVGKAVIEEVQQVAPDGESYTGRATTTFYDASGAVVSRLSSTATGTRVNAVG